MSRPLFVDRALALVLVDGGRPTSERKADEVVQSMYRNLPDDFLADMLQAGKRDYGERLPEMVLVCDAIGRELERRAQGAA